ncbi:hypothetical protein NE237_033029 [Protea cynaroides]|uniref:PH domain-containing protein n=1 Tax=Protea cynaroides TaxID=273540 RepID=A0A9Q0L490_9MAGN|nr:hypothetical protein NE237_033029 [Protea cynaroides]
MGIDFDFGPPAALNQEVEEKGIEGRDSKGCCGSGIANGSVAGILYKWVNYGKGWRSRWFVLDDGVLLYYKVHGPDKISTSPMKEKSINDNIESQEQNNTSFSTYEATPSDARTP